jgi:hypothetical protein
LPKGRDDQVSVKAISWVFDQSPYELGARLVHLALADVCNDAYDGRLWLRQADIARKAKMSTRQVSRILATMVDDGYLIVVDAGGGRGKPTVYRMLTDHPKTRQDVMVFDEETLTSATTNPDICDTQTLTSATSDYSLTQIETQGTEIVSNKSEQFSTFWNAYPKRNGKRLYKPQAVEQWKKLKSDETQPAIIGAGFYAKSCEEGLQIAKDPYRWIRDKCWVDWQEAAVAEAPKAKDPMRRGGSLAAKHARLREAEQRGNALGP